MVAFQSLQAKLSISKKSIELEAIQGRTDWVLPMQRGSSEGFTAVLTLPESILALPSCRLLRGSMIAWLLEVVGNIAEVGSGATVQYFGYKNWNPEQVGVWRGSACGRGGENQPSCQVPLAFALP